MLRVSRTNLDHVPGRKGKKLGQNQVVLAKVIHDRVAEGIMSNFVYMPAMLPMIIGLEL